MSPREDRPGWCGPVELVETFRRLSIAAGEPQPEGTKRRIECALRHAELSDVHNELVRTTAARLGIV